MRSSKWTGGLARAMALPLLLVVVNAHAASCTVSTPGIAFGNYDPVTGTEVNGVSTVRVDCTNLDFLELLLGFGVTVAADGGGSGNRLLRRMSGPLGSQMFYNLYVSAPDNGRTWGDGTGGTHLLTGTVGGFLQPNHQEFTVRGRITAGQNALAAGAYSDQVVVTVTF